MTTEFIGPVHHINGVILEPLHARILSEIITVPAYFISDGLTIPWYVRWFAALFGITQYGKFFPAAVIHDYLVDYNRRQADVLFKRAVQLLGATPIQTFLMYRAVRLGTYNPWIYK